MERASIPTDIHDAVVEFTYDHIDWSSGTGERVEDEYREDMGIEDDSEDIEDDFFKDFTKNNGSEVDHTTEEFKNWFSEYVRGRYAEVEYELASRIKNGKIILYRAMAVPRGWKPNSRHLGIYWTWEEHSAEAYWQGREHISDPVIVVLKGEVDENEVDWVATLGMNADPAYEEEQEVRLKPNAHINLLDYTFKDEAY
jgi:hypothetical protein